MNDAIRLATAKINEAEAALTAANAAITEDIRGLVNAGERAGLEAAYDRAIKGVLALHERLDRAIKDSDVITPQSGK